MNYIGVIGFASSALRDARAVCKYCFVTGFTSVSKYYFNDPKLCYGNSEGIGWVRDDGTFDKNIFKRKEYIVSKRISLEEIINNIL